MGVCVLCFSFSFLFFLPPYPLCSCFPLLPSACQSGKKRNKRKWEYQVFPPPPKTQPLWISCQLWGEFQHSHDPSVYPAIETLCYANICSSPLYLLTFFICTLWFHFLLLITIVIVWNPSQLKVLLVTAYLTYQNVFIADCKHFYFVCIYLDHDNRIYFLLC